MFEPYMHEDDVFDDKEKYTFLADLKRSFDKVRNLTKSDFKVTTEDRKCNGCSLGKVVKHFEVANNKTNSYIGSFGFLIDVENGILKNIYRCLNYKETKKVFVKPKGLPGIFMKNMSSRTYYNMMDVSFSILLKYFFLSVINGLP